jgi:ketosteroid isomerase-like protein
MEPRSFITGAAAAVGVRALLPVALKAKFKVDVAKLNAGEHAALLTAYADDAVLHFNEGNHRWAGKHVGKPAIDRFLRDYTAAKVQGEIKQITVSGPPWALVMWVRFDDHADGPDGTRLYANRTVLVLRTRWGKVVEQEDFYVDTAPIEALDAKLTELGIAPAV